MKKLVRTVHFTLMEMIISMGVFVLLVTIAIRFYNTSFSATSNAIGNNMVFENSRIALDMITRDLQTIYYKNDAIPFWHWAPEDPEDPPASWEEHRNGFLAFVSATDLPQNSNCVSSLNEIKYERYYSTNKTDSNNGWLRRSTTGDRNSLDENNPKWNFYYNFIVGYTTSVNVDTPVASFTANSMSSESYHKVIPYVTDLSFTCYDINGDELDSDHTESVEEDACYTTPFPYSVKVKISLMDKDAWNKWLSMFTEAQYPQEEPDAAKTFRINNERTFSKTVFIGDRGQYD